MMAGPITYKGVHHVGLLVSDRVASKDFYINVLGMSDDDGVRPNLPFKGAFVRAGDQQIHLMELPSVDPKTGRPAHGGRDRHVAVSVDDIVPLENSLTNAGRDFTRSKSGRKAIFTRDLDGNALEFVQVEQ